MVCLYKTLQIWFDLFFIFFENWVEEVDQFITQLN